jgi:hypothetical protein
MTFGSLLYIPQTTRYRKWLIGPTDYNLKRRMSFPITNLSEYRESFVSEFAEATRL